MFLLAIVKQAVMITVFVLVMMLVIEYIIVQTKGKHSHFFSKNPWLQILLAAFLGIIPGCLGTFAVVSMYVHRTVGIAALITALIATSGDEAFVMFAMIPSTALKLMIIIFAISLISGFVIQLIFREKKYIGRTMDHKFVHNNEPECVCFDPKTILIQIKKMIWQRAVLIIFGMAFLSLLFFGADFHEHNLTIIETEHTEDTHYTKDQLHVNDQIDYQEEKERQHEEHLHWGWEKITFFIVTLIGLFIAFTVPDHFLKKHLWGHVIKKHFLRLLLWTFSAFLVLHFLNEFIDVRDWIKGNIYFVILIAALIGLIPESGPHIIFISLFASGIIPFAVLLTNSIVQDGHGSIPLLAESGKSFLVAKLVNVVVGLIVGYLFILI
ncbi:MAG: putative manganese transporter [Bacteroidales bacterium]|nr:putative manganese transporter [Bacteroidales bacterium]